MATTPNSARAHHNGPTAYADQLAAAHRRTSEGLVPLRYAMFVIAANGAAEQPIGHQPRMQAFRAASVEKRGQQEKRRGRKQGDDHANCPKHNGDRSSSNQQKPRETSHVAARLPERDKRTLLSLPRGLAAVIYSSTRRVPALGRCPHHTLNLPFGNGQPS